MSDVYKIFSFPANKWIEICYDAGPLWQQEIFHELIQNNYIVEVQEATYQVQLQIKRKTHDQWKDMLLVRGTIVGNYATACIRCLVPTSGIWNQQFQVVFLAPHLEKTPDFVDLETMLIENEEWELHFYHKNEFSLGEIIREELVVAIPSYPLHAPDCKGLCPICGHDRNLEMCPHGKCPQGI